MKVIKRYSQHISIAKHISQDTIKEARYAYSSKFARYATEICLSGKALRDMFAEIGEQHIPVHFNNETVQGLVIVLDPSLSNDEWVVGTSNEIIEEL